MLSFRYSNPELTQELTLNRLRSNSEFYRMDVILIASITIVDALRIMYIYI
jgi:hypothetical protein